MSSWFDIRIRYEPAKLRTAQAKIIGHPDKVMTFYYQELQGLTAAAADVMRSYLNDRPNYTKTGQKRKAAGGNGPGRVKSGLMKDSIKSNASGAGGIKDAKGNYQFKFGWINGTPGYSVFQEYGTKNGVMGMHAIIYAQEFAKKEIRLLKSGGKGTTFGRTYKEFPSPNGSAD